MSSTEKSVYLDYGATTPCDERVLQTMIPYFTTKFGNPHSKSHVYGWTAEDAIENARSQIAKSIGAETKEIIFTSGATESNNIAIKGALKYHASQGKNHIITTKIEHKCVLQSCLDSKKEYGASITFLDVQNNGLIDIELLKQSIQPNTLMVSILWVNNEIGVIQNIEKIGEICRQNKIYLHVDAAQALGRIFIDVNKCNIDIMSMSGHKIYGPKGIGALYVRKKPRVYLSAITSGGMQERGLRSGTLPTPLCVGMGKAAELATKLMKDETEQMQQFSQYMLETLKQFLPSIYVNGDLQYRIPHNLNISFAGVEGESLMMKMNEIAISSGSACTSGLLEGSYVLKALGVQEELAHTSLRIVFGRFTTMSDVKYATNRIIESVNHLRKMSPIWKMMEDGIDLNSIDWD